MMRHVGGTVEVGRVTNGEVGATGAVGKVACCNQYVVSTRHVVIVASTTCGLRAGLWRGVP